MHLSHDALILAPTDLSAFLGCRHRSGLDLAVAHGLLKKPTWTSAALQALQERGAEHEQQYIESLRAAGLRVVDISVAGAVAGANGKPDTAARVAATLEAIREGVEVIVQGALEHADPVSGHTWRGYADVLRRVDRVDGASALGSWSYEVYDTKLARETRGGTILQLAVYSELLAAVQGVVPEYFHVVTPDPKQPLHTFRVDDYAAYYRFVMRQMVEELGPDGAGPSTAAAQHALRFEPPDDTARALVDAIRGAHYPEPVEQCEVCRWWERCNARRRADDHLSFIANCGRLHRAELQAHGIATLAAAAKMPLPLTFKPARGSGDTYERLREQARLQLAQRDTGQPTHELLAVEPGRGLARLPAPSPGDLFLDLEAARFACEGGREYLFGLWSAATGYRAWWATDAVEERAAFDAVMAVIMSALAADPGMHVYHFGHYETSAFKRLMGRHALAADDLDRLLRGERFVNLHTIVTQALRAGVESYSIKKLEPFYGFTRDVDLREASANLQAIELALEAATPGIIPEEVRAAVEGYNRDDCRSTQALREWLELLRAGLEAAGTPVARPEPQGDAPSEDMRELDAEVAAIRAQLLADLAPEAMQPGHPQHPMWLLAYLIDWHRREDKAQWWDYFRIRDLDDEALLDEGKAIARLVFVQRIDTVKHKRSGKPTGSVVDRYGYPIQECEIGRRCTLTRRDGGRVGEVVAIDRTARLIDIRKGPTAAEEHADVVFDKSVVPSVVVQRSVMRLASDFLAAPPPSGLLAGASAGGVPGDGASSCGLDLLFRHPPRLVGGLTFEQARRRGAPNETDVDFAVRIVSHLHRSTLAIQGPPGAGKTYAGARMIRQLVREGRRVGVTAVSHKVIRNLLDEVAKQAKKVGEAVRLGHRTNDEPDETGPVREFTDNDEAIDALRNGEVNVLGGTAWLWSREPSEGAADVLFIDEAGQMSLAYALAVSRAAANLVLLGDPQQLEQPQKASHPPGCDVSALEHVLGGEKTMPSEQGIFLPVTWRLAPAVCRFTSEVFYEGRLHAREGLERQRLTGAGPFDGAGLWWVPVDHDGNQNSSMEEVDAVAQLVARLLAPGVCWENDKGEAQPLTAAALRIVAPYNAQVNRLTERLEGRGVDVGTVDKFQGQEAPVVIYSMATSRPEDAPRGMEFLYSLNRLNVATSRARCAAIVVASPRLFEPECRTPRQMQLANALCRFRELAQ